MVWWLAFVVDFGIINFNLKKKFDMENKTSINHENGNDANRLLGAVPTDEEIMRAIHTTKIVEPENGFKNAFMDKKFVAGFLTAVKWMSERHCR
jgi:hypothetical protein